MVEIRLKNIYCERNDEENEEDGSHSSKIEQRTIQGDSSPKSGKSLKKRKTRKQLLILFFIPSTSSSQSLLHLDEERREVKNKVKRSKGKDLLVRLRFYRLLIPGALRVRKKTKKPRGSTLYQMKINLNGTSRISFRLMQRHILRNASQRKVFTNQSVKYIQYQTT